MLMPSLSRHRGFQRFKQRDARRDNSDLVARAQTLARQRELFVIA